MVLTFVGGALLAFIVGGLAAYLLATRAWRETR